MLRAVPALALNSLNTIRLHSSVAEEHVPPVVAGCFICFVFDGVEHPIDSKTNKLNEKVFHYDERWMKNGG